MFSSGGMAFTADRFNKLGFYLISACGVNGEHKFNCEPFIFGVSIIWVA